MLLRVISLSEKSDEYEGNLSKFLNDYMHSNMNASDQAIEELNRHLERLASTTRSALRTINSKVSLTYIEAVLIGILANIDQTEKMAPDELSLRFSQLVDELYEGDLARYAVASETKVRDRINIAKRVFG